MSPPCFPKVCDDGQGAGVENTVRNFFQRTAKHENKGDVSEDQFCLAYISTVFLGWKLEMILHQSVYLRK